MFERSKKLWNRIRRKKQGKQILNVKEIAEKIGAFPSDVEETVKGLQEQGMVTCYLANGEIYVVFVGETSMEDIQSHTPRPLEVDDPMFR